MNNKNLLVVGGSWSSSTYNDFEKVLAYVKSFGKDVDVIVSSDDDYLQTKDYCFCKTKGDPTAALFPYKCLDNAIIVKNKKQLHELVYYDNCFFLSTKEEEFTLPSSPIEVYYKNIASINGRNLEKISERFPVTLVSTKFWYSKSLDFDYIGKLWKSNFATIFNHPTYYRSPEFKDLPDRLNSDNLSVAFTFFINSCFIYPKFLNTLPYTTDLGSDKEIITYPKNTKKKVAICLSGEIRCLEALEGFYTYLLTIKEIELDFYLATWANNYTEALLSMLPFKKTSILDPEGVKDKLRVTTRVSNDQRYSFLLKECNILKQKYEQENNIVYDIVICTRPDAIFTSMLEEIAFLDSELEQSSQTCDIRLDGGKTSLGGYKTVDDNLAYMTSIASDVYTNMHFCYLNNPFNKPYHSLEINYFAIQYYNLSWSFLRKSSLVIIRTANLYKWKEFLKSVDFSSPKLREILKKIMVSTEHLNLRRQEGINGYVFLDLRKNPRIFKKLGNLSYLEHYLYTLGWTFNNDSLYFIIDKENKPLLEALKLDKILITRKHTVIDSELQLSDIVKKYVLEDLHPERRKRNLALIDPQNFYIYQHINIHLESDDYDATLLQDEFCIVNSQRIENFSYRTVKELLDCIRSNPSINKVETKLVDICTFNEVEQIFNS